MKRLDYISNLRFPLIVEVVLAHASVFMPESVREGTVASLLLTLLRISVPVFFVISGFLFFMGVEFFGKKLYLKKLRSRVHTLLIPYVMWILICLLYMALKHLPVIIQTHSFDSIQPLLTWRIFWMYNEGLPLHLPLWYVRDLIVICLFSPIVWFLFSRLRHFAMLGIWILFMIHNIDKSISFPTSIFYFSLGSYLAICRIDMQNISQKLGWSILIIAAIAIVCSVQGVTMLTRFSQAVLALSLLGLSCFVTNKYQCKIPAVLTDSVFFVYASHTIFFVSAANYLFTALIPDTACCALIYLRLFMVGLLTIAICISLYILLRHLSPRLLSILTGNRL